MKTILVPVDFSPVAENALYYASEFNRKLNAKILIYHSRYVPVPVMDIPGTLLVADEDLKSNAEEALRGLQDKFLKNYPEMEFQTLLSKGFLRTTFGEVQKNSQCDLVIIGTKGASGLKEALIGSNAAEIVGLSTAPVLVVPDNAMMKGLKKIAYAADYGNHNFIHVAHLIDFARLFDAELILFHITSGKLEEAFENSEIAGFKNKIVNESGYSKISFQLIKDNDVYNGLSAFLEETQPDLLAMSMRDRTVIQKFFNRSLTKKITYHTRIPVLAFHIPS